MKKFLIFLLVLNVSIAYSQHIVTEGQKDLKVGLVLSGGGAKGFAHIAILKLLDEAGVRIDYIGGTSMGAIIGSMYASGYSGKEIDSLMKLVDFEKLMLDDIPRKSKPFFEKQHGEKYALVLPIVNNKVGLPLALSSGQNVLNLLSELLHHVDSITDFKKLPIPFVCIATDIETGENVVLNEGFLPISVQASGAFPTLLTPVEIDGRLLVDGGITNNFPVDEVKKMGPDIIIGVELSNNNSEDVDLSSAVKIVNQIMNFQIYANYDEQRANTDVLIHPDMTDFGVTSFEFYDEIYEKGDIAGRSKYDEFVKIAKQQSTKRVHKPIEPKPKKIYIKEIKIEGNKDYTNSYVRSKMKIEAGMVITHDAFLDGINNLTATGNFSNIQYQINHTDDGTIISLRLTQNPISANVKLALHYDHLYKTAMLVNVTAKHVISKNDVISLDLILGDNIRYNFDYFIDNDSDWSIGIKSRYNTFDSDVDFDWVNSEINQINLEYRDFTNLLYVQKVFNRAFALGMGAEHKNIRAFTETFLPVTPVNNNKRNYFDKADYLNFISYIKFDTYNQKYFPKTGFNFDVYFRWYLLSSDYANNFNTFSQINGKLGYARSFFNNKFTAHVISEAGLSIGENEIEVLKYHLGGLGENYINTFIPFYGYKFGKLSGEEFLLTTLQIRYEIFKNHYLTTTAAAARVGSDLFNSGNIFEDTKFGYGGGYGFDSFLGPIELNYTYSPDTKVSFWYFNLGFWF